MLKSKGRRELEQIKYLVTLQWDVVKQLLSQENDVLLRMRSSISGDDTDMSPVAWIVFVTETSGTLSGRRETFGALVYIMCPQH